MKIAFVDHYYHKSTKSSEFFIRDVLADCTIERFWDESWAGGGTDSLTAKVLEGGFDLIVVWQAEHTARRLAAALSARGGGNMVFIPMWDGCHTLGASFWMAFRGVRVLSFSRALHERVSRYGILSYWAQYFPDPSEYSDVSGLPDAAAFFWWRVAEMGWPQIRATLGRWRPDRFHLHLAPDPPLNTKKLRLPAAQEIEDFRISTSTWFEDAASFRNALLGANIFFAPRLAEGIGMATLEAMASGMCVVAHDAPTMNEYIVSGVNGLLANMTAPSQLDFSAHRKLGIRARSYVAYGHEAWQAMIPEIQNFVRMQQGDQAARQWNVQRLRDAGELPAARKPAGVLPKVTVATVVRDDPDGIAATIANVARQDYGNLEYLVLDGGSEAPTIEAIRRHGHLLSHWISEPDLGPFDAMNKAAAMASGDYIIFMNAGDWFAGPDAISRAFRAVPQDADFVIGHHIFRTSDGREELHRAADFDQTWARLRSGALDEAWLQGIPGHQATFTRTELLRKYRYDCRFRICADHEFMYRMRKAGARFHHCLDTISVYTAGGLSERSRLRLVEEWIELASRYGSDGAVTFFHHVRSHMQREGTPERAVAPAPESMSAGDLAAECMVLREEAAALRSEIAYIRRSASWIVTYPLRWLMRHAGPLRKVWAHVRLPGRQRPL